MPIRDIGKYKRPGIFIEEFDNSLVTLPVQDVLINLVPGFSRKGTINNPIYIDNSNDFEKIYGTLDKQLEYKGSFFHRTALKMLETGPIWALNLLKTDATRDKLQWKSVSLSASYFNGALNQSPYERFFNRQDFWKRDDESFLDLVNDPAPDNNRLLHITNMGDKTITTFMFKSSTRGFDITAENWYGGLINVPEFINSKDLISDYILSVLVISGDWTDYNSLSVDTTYSKYFTSTGLNKNKVQDFVNNRNISILANYDVCLIPNFKDKSGRDMYIKNVINNDTDKTGLFCAYNEDELLGSDYPKGKLDIIGNTLVGEEQSEIDFLSYKETLTEDVTYQQKYLDSSGNVFGMSAVVSATSSNRTDSFNKWSTYNFRYLSATSGTTNHTIKFNVVTADAFYVINGEKISFTGTGSNSYDTLLDPLTNTEVRRYDQLYLSSDNSQVYIIKGAEILSGDTTSFPDYNVNNTDTIHLGYVTILNSGGVTTVIYNAVTVNDSGTGFVPIATTGIGSGTAGVYVSDSTDPLNSGDTSITIEFTGTLGTKNLANYDDLRIYKIYDDIAEKIQSGKAVIISTATNRLKSPIGSGYLITDWSTTENAKIKIYVDTVADYVTTGGLLLYFIDDEFILGNNTNQATTRYEMFTGSDTIGIVAKYSTFYQNYIDGIINALDYFVQYNQNPATFGVTKIYIRPYLRNEVLTVQFAGSKELSSGLITTANWSTTMPTGYGSELIVWSNRGNYKQTVEIEEFSATDFSKITEIKVDKTRYSEITVGTYLEGYYDESDIEIAAGAEMPRKMVRIIKTSIDSVNANLKILYADSPIKVVDNDLSGTTDDYMTTAYPSIDVYVTEYKGVSIPPFKIHPDSIPDGTEVRQEQILSVIGKNADTSLSKGLINKNKISWRYLVDSFGLGLVDNSKQELMSLCGKKLNCLGFLNMPSARMLRKSNNPSFTNDDGSLSLTYLKQGGNLDKNPAFLYSFGEGDGESCVGYFFPYVNDTTSGVEKSVPPAAFVATTYMQKHITSTAGIQAWTICAGLTNGKISVGGTEMDFTNEDLEDMYEMGANPIIRDINNGFYINSESTAQMNPVTSLSYIHSREVLIELENTLYNMLLRYHWKFNTPTVRSEIKYRADKICKEFLDANALYDYRNVIDDSNNTKTVIENQMGVLDTFVEIVKGLGIIVNNITILSTGQISSGGFNAA
jgi:hypothetical protein